MIYKFSTYVNTTDNRYQDMCNNTKLKNDHKIHKS